MYVIGNVGRNRYTCHIYIYKKYYSFAEKDLQFRERNDIANTAKIKFFRRNTLYWYEAILLHEVTTVRNENTMGKAGERSDSLLYGRIHAS